MKKIGILVGSLRKESYNRKVAKAFIGQLPAGYEANIIEIGQLPLYNEDIDQATPPQEYTDFRSTLEQYDAFVFVTPEYNRSFTAAIKNALDVGSRPYGQSKWNGKPAAVISASMGGYGGFGANHHLRQSLVFLNMPVVQQPEVYIGTAQDSFDEAGQADARLNELLKSLADAFADLVERY